VGYYDPDADQWTEGIADIESGEWIPVDAVRGTGGRDCPPGFPVKGNLPSRVFHTPGQQDYDRTSPEVCFASEAAALDAGFRHSRLGAGAAAAAAPVVAAAAPRPDADTPTPPPPPRPTAPPPPREPDRNWLWWILGALAIAALLWWFFFRPQQEPAVEVTPEATVAAPAATTPAEEEEEEDEEAMGIVATPAASPVAARATPMGAMASPAAMIATPMGARDEATPMATPDATAVADAIETAEAELEETETP
jgi:hypothetical protein